MGEILLAVGMPSSYDALNTTEVPKQNITEDTQVQFSARCIVRAVAYCYLLVLLTTKERQSNFNTFCTRLCLGLILIEIYGVYCAILGRLSEKLSFVMEKLSFLNIWLVILAMIHKKLCDSLENDIMVVIFGASFIMSAVYSTYTYVHVCEKRRMTYFERETSSDNSGKFAGAAVRDGVNNNEDDNTENMNAPFLSKCGPLVSIGHAYLILCFLDEKESTSQISGIFLCLISAYIGFNDFFMNFFHATNQKLSFGMHIFFFVNIWLAALILMHIKLHDFYTNIAFGIYALCFVLSAIYFAYVHAFEKDPFPYFTRETCISDITNLKNGSIVEVATMVFTVLIFVHAYFLLRFMHEEASNFRTLGIFLCLTSGLVEFNGLFYSLCGPDRVAMKLLHLMRIYSFVNWGITVVLFLPVVDSKHSLYSTVAFAISALYFIFMGIYSILNVLDKDSFSYLKRWCNIIYNLFNWLSVNHKKLYIVKDCDFKFYWN